MSSPTLTFIAGANGSGKTTLTRWNSELFREIPVLDPDTIGKTLQSSTSAAFPIAGARQVLESAAEHLRNRNSFAVRNRVLAGGHDVPPTDVRRRYLRSLKNLPTAIKRADHAILFDNSTEEGYRLIAILGPTERQWLSEPPNWASSVSV